MNDDPNPDDLRDLESLLAQLDEDDLDIVPPPAEVWTGISAVVAGAGFRERGTVSTVHPIGVAPRRRGWRLSLAAVAAAIVLIAVGVATVVDRDPDQRIVSAAALRFDPAAFDPRGSGAAAEAQLLDQGGRYAIRLVRASLPRLESDDLELWLIRPDAAGNPVDVAPVSLIDPDGDGTYEVPSDIDPSTHFVVDISIEPRDGDAAHSGKSILRGALAPLGDGGVSA